MKWLCTGVSLCISLLLAGWSLFFKISNGLMSTDILIAALYDFPTTMCYFIPAWLPEILILFAPQKAKWLRLVGGAICVSLGIVVMIALVLMQGRSAFLAFIALGYLTLGAFNIFIASRVRAPRVDRVV